MRVTDSALYERFVSSLNSHNEAIGRALQQIADGKRVRVASDDPAAARTALALRARLVRTEGYKTSAGAARHDLATLEARLGELSRLVTSAHTKAIASSVAFPEANANLANEVDALRDDVLLLGNTFQNGRYLFGGTLTLDAPFDSSGAYVGNDDEAQASIDLDQTVGVTLSGARVLQDGGDILTTLSDLSTALRNNDSDAVIALGVELDAQTAHLNQLRQEIGSRLQSVDRGVVRLEDEQLRLQTRIIEIEDVDLARAATDLAQASNAGEALSQAAARVLGRSLFNFLG